MALRRRDSEVAGEAPEVKVEGGLFAKSCPTLWEFLACGVFEDGSSRKLGTLTVFVDGDGVKGCLNDREQGLTAFASAASLDGLLAVLERGLAEDRLDWRRPTPPRKKR